MSRTRKLPRSFYNRPTLTVARELIGKHLVVMKRGKRCSARIVEVEAYIGENDKASHAAPGLTARNAIMYGPAGFSYVYFIYGMYYCLNFVTERKGYPAAVLIRAAEPRDGHDLMRKQSPRTPPHLLLSGPGRLCRSLSITTKHSGLDLTGNDMFLEDHRENAPSISVSPRIGIRKATELEWRFVDVNSNAVSGSRTAFVKSAKSKT